MLPRSGRSREAPTAIPDSVLTAVRASAPASAIARAIGRMSATLGESLTMSGRSVARRAAADVGAGDVELDAGHAGDPIEALHDLHVVADRFAGDIDDHWHPPAGPR